MELTALGWMIFVAVIVIGCLGFVLLSLDYIKQKIVEAISEAFFQDIECREK